MDIEMTQTNEQINKALIYSPKGYIKGQQGILDKFYKEYFTWSCINIGYWIVAGIFSFIQAVFMMLPYEQVLIEGRGDGFEFMMGFIIAFPVTFYLQPYISYNEKSNVGSVYSKLKYLPISFKSIKVYRFRKMLKFILRLFLICAVLQLGISLLAFHRILPGTVIHLVLYGFLVPFTVGSLEAWFSK